MLFERDKDMKYVIASDYDGTVAMPDGISERTKKGIKEFKEKGNIFGIVSGRDYVNGYLELKEKGDLDFDFIIMGNGASACDKDGNIYYSKKINGAMPFGETTLAQELVKKCLELTPFPCNIAFEKSRWTFYDDYSFEESNTGIKHEKSTEIEPIGDFVSASTMCKTEEEARKVVEILKEEFGKYLNPVQNGWCIDIVPVGIDKGVGIELLCKELGVCKDQVWTAGDNYNDMPMLEKYHGCAISSGVKEIQSVAEYVCDDVYDLVKIILMEEQNGNIL